MCSIEIFDRAYPYIGIRFLPNVYEWNIIPTKTNRYIPISILHVSLLQRKFERVVSDYVEYTAQGNTSVKTFFCS